MECNGMEYQGHRGSMAFDLEDEITVDRFLDIEEINAFHGLSETQFELIYRIMIANIDQNNFFFSNDHFNDDTIFQID
jgi:predicted HicB family RNase H-like nuclease